MSAALRVGVIGVGDFGERHLAALSEENGVTVVAVADRDGSKAEAVADRWGVREWFDDGADLVRACRPDGVSVVTPGRHHLEPTLVALENGCSVLLEKPVVLSSADADRIAAAIADSTAFVLPAHILRFAAPYVELRARVRSGAMGKVLGISAQRHRTRTHERLFPGVHPVLMTMIHDIDLALWITGSHPLRVSAQAPKGPVEGPVAPLTWAHAEADDGSVWSFRTSWLLPDGMSVPDRLEVFGSEGVAVLDLEPTVTVFGKAAEFVDHELTPELVPGAIGAEVSHFCSCLRAGAPSDTIGFAEAAEGIRIAEAVIRSSEAGGTQTEVPG